MEHIYEQPQFGENWFTYPNLYKEFVEKLTDRSTIVEVGSWKGKSTSYLAVEIINSNKDIKLHAVDTWKGSPSEKDHANDYYVKTDSLYELFLKNIAPVSSVIIPIRKPSIDAAKDYQDNSLDVVFIDACHDYSCVKEDIAAWLPKVKCGGILSGHDYGWEGVKKAVHEVFSEEEIRSQELCWVYQKP